MNIAGLTSTEVSSLPYLLGDGADGKKNSWGKMPVGTSYSFMLGGLKQMSNGYQGQSFITGSALYLPDSITDISMVASLGAPVTLPLVSVLQRAITEDRTMVVGSCYKITYLGKVNASGQAVNYDNFKIEAYNSPELDKASQDCWVAHSQPLDLSIQYSVTSDTVKGGELLVVNGVVETPAPVAPPVAQPPVAPAPAPAGTPPPPIKM